MKRILAYMDFMCPSGFGTVAHNVWDRLTPWLIENDIVVEVAALNYAGKETHQYNSQITVIDPGLFARNYDDNYFRDGATEMAAIGDYDLVWMMNDIPIVGPMARFFKQINDQRRLNGQKTFKTVIYTPIDSAPYTRYFYNLEFFDRIFTYTEYGKSEFEKAYRQQNDESLSIGIIGHGIDEKSFFQIPTSQNLLKEKYDLPPDAFVFGHINKNQPRKDVGGTLIAFAKFKEWHAQSEYSHQKIALYLHCDPEENNGINLYVATERTGLRIGREVFLPNLKKYIGSGYSKSELNEVYNSLDCFVTTTTAEGWGLTVTEAMSCGLPIICGLHTSLNEITDNGSLVYGCSDLIPFIQNEDGENIRWKLNPDEVCERMKEVYIDSVIHNKTRHDYSRKLSQYNWDTISQEWQEVFHSLLFS
jgi:glycosyltransferase involved in cell wall biosynthesis